MPSCMRSVLGAKPVNRTTHAPGSACGAKPDGSATVGPATQPRQLPPPRALLAGAVEPEPDIMMPDVIDHLPQTHGVTASIEEAGRDVGVAQGSPALRGSVTGLRRVLGPCGAVTARVYFEFRLDPAGTSVLVHRRLQERIRRQKTLRIRWRNQYRLRHRQVSVLVKGGMEPRFVGP